MFGKRRRLSEENVSLTVSLRASRCLVLSLLLQLLGLGLPFAQAQSAIEITTQPTQPTLPIDLGASFRLVVGAKSDTRLQYQWLRNGVRIPNQTDFVISIQKFTPDQGGLLSVLVANDTTSVRSRNIRLVPNIARLPFTDAMDPRQIGDKDFPNRINGLSGHGIGDNFKATVSRDLGEPLHADVYGGASMWLVWRPGVDGIASIRTKGSGFDTLLAVYVQRDLRSPLSYKNLTLVASNDDAEAFKTSAVQFNVQPGVNYFIAVDGDGAATRSIFDQRSAVQRGDIVLTWSVEQTTQKLPVWKTVLPDQNLTLGSQLLMDGSVDAGAADDSSYQWYFKGLPLDGARGAVLSLDRITRANVGRYYCEAKATFGLTTRAVTSRVVDVQMFRRSNNSDAHILAQDKLSVAADYTFDPLKGIGVARAGAGLAAGRDPQTLGVSLGTSGTQIFNTIGAGKDEGEPDHCGQAGGASEWYALLAEEDGVIVADTIGSEFDTVLAAYVDSGSGVGLYDGLVSLGCGNDSPGLGKQSRVAFSCLAGQVYYLVVDGVAGASGLVQLNYEMVRALSLVSQPEGVISPVGGAAKLKVEAVGVGALAYQWRKGGSNIAGANLAELSLTNLKKSDAGNYDVIVSDDVTNRVSNVAVVQVLQPLNIIAQPVSVTTNTGGSVQFLVGATGELPMQFQWFKDGAEISGKTSNVLTLMGVTPADEAGYHVVIRSTSGNATSVVAQLTVRVPPAITTEPADVQSAPGSPVSLSVVATGKPAPSYQWRLGGLVLPGKVSATYSIGALQLEHLGGYSVVVSNAAGSVTSRVASVTFPPGPAPSLKIEPNLGGPVKITVIGTAGFPYVLERSTNLVQWVPIRTNLNGGFQYAETPGPSAPIRWFRAFRQ